MRQHACQLGEINLGNIFCGSPDFNTQDQHTTRPMLLGAPTASCRAVLPLPAQSQHPARPTTLEHDCFYRAYSSRQHRHACEHGVSSFAPWLHQANNSVRGVGNQPSNGSWWRQEYSWALEAIPLQCHPSWKRQLNRWQHPVDMWKAHHKSWILSHSPKQSPTYCCDLCIQFEMVKSNEFLLTYAFSLSVPRTLKVISQHFSNALNIVNYSQHALISSS